jgi:hypothetical protein
MKVNGWLEQANLRTLVEIRVRFDRAGAPKVDRTVLDFVKSQVFNPEDFTVQLDGVVRLNPKLARWVPKIFLLKLGRSSWAG